MRPTTPTTWLHPRSLYAEYRPHVPAWLHAVCQYKFQARPAILAKLGGKEKNVCQRITCSDKGFRRDVYIAASVQ